jgi:hypothetical protein
LLLEPLKNVYLVRTLYGILMLLPQGKAYNALAKRLKSVEILLQLESNISPIDLNDERYVLNYIYYFNNIIVIKC